MQEKITHDPELPYKVKKIVRYLADSGITANVSYEDLEMSIDLSESELTDVQAEKLMWSVQEMFGVAVSYEPNEATIFMTLKPNDLH